MENFNSIINSDKPVLVDFYADWCGPCKIMAPILKDVKQQVGDNVAIIKIDVDRNQNAAAAYQIRSIPTLMLFKQGKILWKQAGVVQKEELLRLLSSHL